MAEILKRELDLVVLRIFLDRQGSSRRSQAVFSVEAARQQMGDPVTIDLDALGLPPQLEQIAQHRYFDVPIQIPATLVDRIRGPVLSSLAPGDPLWLELALPTGNLPVVNWERALQPTLGVPILRLPYFATQPAPPDDALDIVLCASSPQAKEPVPVQALLATMTARIRAALPNRPLTIHVFSDAPDSPSLFAGEPDWVEEPLYRTRVYGPGPIQTRVYGPASITATETPPRSATVDEEVGRVDSPWLRWIVDTFGTRSADIVHFLCHGYLSSEQGAIALAESPLRNSDRNMARFVGPRQLDAFLTRIGAWSIGFSSPPLDYSLPGLRLLADRIGRLRPGSVFVHEFSADSDGAAVERAYRFLYGPDHSDTGPPAMSALSLSCHPGRVHKRWQLGSRGVPSLMLPDDAFTSALPPTKAAQPAWVAASSRYLEQSYARLLESQPTSGDQFAAQQGAAESLRFLADAVLRHAEAQRVAGDEELKS
jgi:hypothetical protein